LPLLYLVYFALANALVVHLGTLVSAFASRPHLRPTLGLAIAGVFAPAFVPIVVFVTYPLWTEPVTVPWLVVPVGLGPLMHGIALAKLAAPAGDLAGERP
jgi:hypothetical protein